MAAIGKMATEKISALLAGTTGLSAALAALQQSEAVEVPAIGTVLAQNIGHEVAERKPGVVYPAVYIYCEGLYNQLREKFRTFSGKAQMVAEVRVTYDRLDDLSRDLELYAAAVAQVLDASRGDWDEGMFYAGGYKVEFSPVKRGGKNFLQTAKVTFEVDVSY